MTIRRVLVCSLLAACGSSKPQSSTTPAAPRPVAAAPAIAPAEPAPATEHEHPPMVMWSLEKLAESAPRIKELGDVHRKVSTVLPEAQTFFDQGLALTYGFNHDEAARSFAKAASLDPKCAMCFWGAAYVLGPNYNIPMLPDRAEAAWKALTSAREVAMQNATPVELALIGALEKRYKGPDYLDPAAMQPFNEAYAAAMRAVAKQFPNDLDVQTLFAESLMNVNPWKLWTKDGKPNKGTDEIVSALEKVLRKDPKHAGANHYYIHAVEASKTPERALKSADRLGSLVPAAGHLVHMPAHIYQRTGKYEQAAESNRKAIAADLAYLEKVTPPGYYPFYLGHNYGFLAYADSMQGKSNEALSAARKSAESLPRDILCGMPGMDFFASEPLLVMVRFGMWDALLKEPAPDAKYPVLVALHHHAVGMALASTGKFAEARERISAIQSLRANLPEGLMAGLNEAKLVLELAAVVVEARIAEAEKRADAVDLWTKAVSLEDQLAYSEPADWFYPTRHFLGALLLDLGKPKDAEKVYRADLERNPNNGWALFGLTRALEAQSSGKAIVTHGQFLEVFKNADIQITRSAF